jgi:hypothetical protein
VQIDEHAIGGVVTGARGSEAGVWVIAETSSLPIKFVRIVVTDERGGYLVPDLPAATYDVWVRGYGLVDSPKVQSAPGKILELKANPAPDAKAAARYYPALYWYSLLAVPPVADFPGHCHINELSLPSFLPVPRFRGRTIGTPCVSRSRAARHRPSEHTMTA